MTTHRRARQEPRDHKLLIVLAVLAVAYCLCAPLIGNLLGQLL